jgi:TP901 family phage tail tape measure protein
LSTTRAKIQITVDGAAGARRDIAGAGEALRGLSVDAEIAQRSLTEVNQALELGKKALALGAVPLGLAQAFETELAAINTISNNAGTKFRNDFLDISVALGRDASEIARAAYEAVGSGVAEAQLREFTEVSAKLATAGRAEVLPTLKVLTTFQNQFGLTLQEVKKAADILFATTKVGVTTIPELASELGDVIPLARGAGLGIETLNAAIAALTKGGLTTSLAATQVKSLATSLLTDIPKTTAALNEVGVSIDAGAFKALSFRDRMVLLATAFKGNEGPLVKAFGRIEGVSAALALGANNAKFFDEALKEINNSAGATDEAFRIMAGTSEFAAAQLRQEFNKELIELTTALLPTLNRVMRDLAEYLKTNGPQIASALQGAVEALVSMGRWVAENGQIVLSFIGASFGLSAINSVVGMAKGIAGLGASLKTVATGAAAARTALSFLNPIGAIVAATTAAFAALAGAVVAVKAAVDKLSEVDIGGQLQSLANGVDLDVRLAQAQVTRAQQRQQVVQGQGVLVNPEDVDRATGQFKGRLDAAVASLDEALSQGFDLATDLVERNLASLEGAAVAQRSRQETALANLEGARADLQALDDEIQRLSLEQAQGNLLVSRDLTLAVNKRSDLITQVTTLEQQAIDARRTAAELELARANLSVEFQRKVQSDLAATFGGLGKSLFGPVARLGQQARAAIAAPNAPTRRPTRGTDPLAGDRRQTQDALRQASLTLIDDDVERQIAAIQQRYDEQIATAKKVKVETVLLERARDVEIQRIYDGEAQRARDRLAESFADRQQAAEAERALAQRVTEARITLIDDDATRQIATIESRLQSEIDAIDRSVMATEDAEALKAAAVVSAEREKQAVRDQVAAQELANITSLRENTNAIAEASISALGGLLNMVAGAGKFEGVMMFARGLLASANVAFYTAEAIAAVNPIASAKFALAAVQSGVAAAAYFKGAATLGAGGGGGGGGGYGGGRAALPRPVGQAGFGPREKGGGDVHYHLNLPPDSYESRHSQQRTGARIAQATDRVRRRSAA